MSYNKTQLIKYRLDKSEKTYQEAVLLRENGFITTSVNRLYYSSFYAVTALFAKHNITAKSHNGVRIEFFKRFIKTKIIDKKYSLTYSDLMDKRQESDYQDFQEFELNDVNYLFDETFNFLKIIRSLC